MNISLFDDLIGCVVIDRVFVLVKVVWFDLCCVSVDISWLRV